MTTFVKGHGTRNDFLLLPDPEGVLDLTAAHVAGLCDRRSGLGADGVLRVVRSARLPEGQALAPDAEWFMDYRNGDGSIAEMCGNGVRVFAAYLKEAGLLGALTPGQAVPIATRSGVRQVWFEPDGQVTVDMGPAVFTHESLEVNNRHHMWAGVGVSMGNPHAVAFVEDLDHLGSLATPPVITPADAFPEGVNVEFVVDREPGVVAFRVFERGVGETESCGTGACAVFAAVRRRDQDEGRDVPEAYRVEVPGGVLIVREVDGHIRMTGPAELVAHGEVELGRWGTA